MRTPTLLLLALFTPTTLAAEKGLQNPDAPAPKVDITLDGDYRTIHSNGLPNHKTGQFPNRGNPNTISPQRYEFRVPLHPRIADQPTPVGMQPFGVAVNGVVFDPAAAEWWNNDRRSGWQIDPLGMPKGYLGVDDSHAHVQPNGAYHYHGLPAALIFDLTKGEDRQVLVGWAADGFPIYNNLAPADAADLKSPVKKLTSSYRLKPSNRPTDPGPGGNYDGKFVADYEYAQGTGDLDECNGRQGATADFPAGTYYYVLTDQFPFIPRQYRGAPDPSFARKGPPRQAGPNAPQRGDAPPGDAAPQNRPTGNVRAIPPFATEALDLTQDQRQQIEALDKETRAKLEKILTPDQMKRLDEARPPRRGPGEGSPQGRPRE